MEPDLKHLDYAGERLRLVGSRVARPGQTRGGHHHGSTAEHSDEKALLSYGPSVSAPIFVRVSNSPARMPSPTPPPAYGISQVANKKADTCRVEL